MELTHHKHQAHVKGCSYEKMTKNINDHLALYYFTNMLYNRPGHKINHDLYKIGSIRHK